MPHICQWIISGKADCKSFVNGHVKTPRFVITNLLWKSEILGSWQKFGKQIKIGFWVEMRQNKKNTENQYTLDALG